MLTRGCLADELSSHSRSLILSVPPAPTGRASRSTLVPGSGLANSHHPLGEKHTPFEGPKRSALHIRTQFQLEKSRPCPHQSRRWWLVYTLSHRLVSAENTSEFVTIHESRTHSVCDKLLTRDGSMGAARQITAGLDGGVQGMQCKLSLSAAGTRALG